MDCLELLNKVRIPAHLGPHADVATQFLIPISILQVFKSTHVLAKAYMDWIGPPSLREVLACGKFKLLPQPNTCILSNRGATISFCQLETLPLTCK
jgi:hypothetical protein